MDIQYNMAGCPYLFSVHSQGSNGKGIAVAWDKPVDVPSYFVAPSNGWLKVHIMRYTANRIYNITLNIASQTYRNSSTELTETIHQGGTSGNTSTRTYFANSLSYDNYVTKGDVIKWSIPSNLPSPMPSYGKNQTIHTFYPCR